MKISLPLNTSIALLAGMALTASTAHAAISATWLTPPPGSTFAVGTSITPTGQTSASGSTGGGSGLDLAVVMDSSGSMSWSGTAGGITQSRQAWQRQFVKDLISSLPTSSTSVAIVEFDSGASVVQQLLPLAGNQSSLFAAVDAVNASGGTNIGTGINAAGEELKARGTAGRTSAMVVFSDGSTSGNPDATADSWGDGSKGYTVNQIHSVGLPGHVTGQM
ncbi:MAG: VWA domain-containing protein, partial [Verrucomicrobiota bacterium]